MSSSRHTSPLLLMVLTTSFLAISSFGQVTDGNLVGTIYDPSGKVVPEASVGFAARLLRRLQEWEETGGRSEFFETVGRRFVYATLALTLVLLLSLVLPAYGPVRGFTGTDFLGMQTENQAILPDLIGGDFLDSHEVISGRLPE